MSKIKLPTCINYYCESPVILDKGGKPRVHCSRCQRASYGGGTHAPGVIPFKTGVCSNIDGQLGFPCLVNWELHKQNKHIRIQTHVDHIDGNGWNHDVKNLQELCPICHNYKSMVNGDHASGRNKKPLICESVED